MINKLAKKKEGEMKKIFSVLIVGVLFLAATQSIMAETIGSEEPDRISLSQSLVDNNFDLKGVLLAGSNCGPGSNCNNCTTKTTCTSHGCNWSGGDNSIGNYCSH